MSLTACIASGSGRTSACLHPGELRVEHLALQHLPGSTRTSPGPRASASRSRPAPAPPRRCRRAASPSSISASRASSSSSPARVSRSAARAWSSAARTWSRVPAEVAAAAGRARASGGPGRRARPGRGARPCRGAAARAAPRAALPPASTSRPDLVQGRADVVRRRERVGTAAPGPVAEPAVRRSWLAVGHRPRRRRRCGRRRCPCRCGGSGAAPPARTRPRRRPRRASASSPWPSRSSTLDRPGTVPSWASRSAAGTSSPVSTTAPSANSSVKPDRSRPASRARNVSATATRSRCVEHLALAALLAHLELDLAEQGRARTVGTSQTRATASASPARAARRSAEPATPSAAAMANRAETPERWSTDGRLAQPAGEPGDDLDQVLGHLGDELGLLARSARPRRSTSSG